MGLKKGMTNNPDGRPKGSKNKSSEAIREMVSTLITDNWEQLQADLKQLQPVERLAFIEKMFQFVIPKLQAQAVKMEDNSKEPLKFILPPISWIENDKPLEESKLFQKSIKILGLQSIGEK
jgi:hypothetical protein